MIDLLALAEISTTDGLPVACACVGLHGMRVVVEDLDAVADQRVVADLDAFATADDAVVADIYAHADDDLAVAEKLPAQDSAADGPGTERYAIRWTVIDAPGVRSEFAAGTDFGCRVKT